MKKQSLLYVVLIFLSSFSPAVYAQNGIKNRLVQRINKEYQLVGKSFRALPKIRNFKSLTEQDKQDLRSFSKRVGGLLLFLALLGGGRILYGRWKVNGTEGLPLPPRDEGEGPFLSMEGTIPFEPNLPSPPAQVGEPSSYVDPSQLPQPVLEPVGFARPQQIEQPRQPTIAEQIVAGPPLKKTSGPTQKPPASPEPALVSALSKRISVRETEPISTELTESWLEGAETYQPTREEEARYQAQAQQVKQAVQQPKVPVKGQLVLTPEQQTEAEKARKELQEKLKKRQKSLEGSDLGGSDL